MTLQTATDTASLSPDTTANMEAILAAVRLVDAPPVTPRAARRGELGGCAACQLTIPSHFDAEGRWIGCSGVKEDGTVFILVPTKRVTTGHRTSRQALREDAPRQMTPPNAVKWRRGLVRARYISNLHHKVSLEKMLEEGKVSPGRLPTLRAVHEAGKDGVTASEVVKRTRRANGIVQNNLHWLRQQKLVTAIEDASVQ